MSKKADGSPRTETMKILLKMTRLEATPRKPALPRVPDYSRPKTRGDCINGPRPCPFVGCRYNLSIDVSRFGSIRYRLGVDWQRPETQANCALDFADEGSRTLEQMAPLMGTTANNLKLEVHSAVAQLTAMGLQEIADQL